MKTIRVIGGIYILSAMWCMLNVSVSSAALGFGFTQPFAQVEYFSVYGGLQLGLGLAMLAVSFSPKALLGGVLFAFVFSSVLAVIRLLAIVLYSANDMMWALFVLEAIIALTLWRCWYRLNLIS
ncbi:MAG: hypothetical protein CL679_05715 [Bermanella sp.]|nr:hypothetical protein [Bermanella sp.]|tara:strand:+ start:3635 stop:4006 length:372 start_codon:yes stop_codon:yes gene_type:complete